MGKYAAEKPAGVFLSQGQYDFLKALAQYILPAAGVLYFALASIWGLPAAEQVVGTIVAVDAFLGAILGISKNSYEKSDAKYDGELVVSESDGSRDLFSFEPAGDLNDLPGKKEVVFKVRNELEAASQE